MKHLRIYTFQSIFVHAHSTKQTAMITQKVWIMNKIEEIPAFIERDFDAVDGKPVQDYYPLVLTERSKIWKRMKK